MPNPASLGFLHPGVHANDEGAGQFGDFPLPHHLRQGDLLWPRAADVTAVAGIDMEAELALPIIRALVALAGDKLPDAKVLWSAGEIKLTELKAWVEASGRRIPEPLRGAVEAAGTLIEQGASSVQQWWEDESPAPAAVRRLRVQLLDKTLATLRNELAELLLDLVWLVAAASGSLPRSSVDADKEGAGLMKRLGLDRVLEEALQRATLGRVYVGHVGMVDVVAGVPWVVESAYLAGGVHILPYEHWLRYRRERGAQVWHGRIRRQAGSSEDILPQQSAQMLAKAHELRMERKRYAIADQRPGGGFAQLGDETRVYCSELVWLAARQAGIDLDARRGLAAWFPFLGPRALAQSPRVRMLNRPGGVDY